jgi:hypothetical protein
MSSTPELKDAERRKSLGKYVKRMSSVFKREKSSKGEASSSVAPSTPAPAAEKKKEATTAA